MSLGARGAIAVQRVLRRALQRLASGSLRGFHGHCVELRAQLVLVKRAEGTESEAVAAEGRNEVEWHAVGRNEVACH